MMRIPSLKDVTEKEEIVRLPDAPVYYIPVKTVAGSTPEVLVKVGDRVLAYQLLAAAPEGYKAPLYAPVSGVVTDITDRPVGKGEKMKTICIQNDYMEESAEPLFPEASSFTGDSLLEIIEKAGILGHGGAEFPAALKYRTKGKKVNTFIINGAECEPYLTADYAVMAQRTRELIEGIGWINRILDAGEVILAVEEENRELLPLFENISVPNSSLTIQTVTVPNEYPQGGELQLIRSVTGIELKKGTIPLEAGIVMSNVGTIYAVREAIVQRRPVIRRVLTVSGEYSGKCGNYEVKLGTPVSDILQQTGYDKSIPGRILLGGPMMGKPLKDLSVPVSQGTNGVLVLPELLVRRYPCIQCGYCVDVCPMWLVPFKYDQFYRQENWKQMQAYDLEDCIDCASCEYICPCEVPLMKSIEAGKKELKKMEDEKGKD